MRVLLIEDEADIADALVRYLRAQGHAVDHAPDLDTARAALAVAGCDAILLDLALPDGSGLVLLREQRHRGNRVPVIIATARDQITERIAGLDAGADDYVVKPYDLAEIEARLRANARRASGDPATESRLGGLRVDRAGARLFKGEAEIRLTSREWALFDALLSARGRCCPSRRWRIASMPSTTPSRGTRSKSMSRGCGASWGPIRSRRGAAWDT